MLRIGTSHFVSLQAAIDYYRDYEGDTMPAELERIVKAKVEVGEIHIGAPDFAADERLVRIDGGKRYAIEKA